MPGKLHTYHTKRNFGVTPEPRGEVVEPSGRLRFVVQKHHARKLHYDFRLEIDGTLKSWAVPKGPSLDPAEKRLAVHVEDHPLDYIDFEGDIPEHQYGAGHVDVWDIGYWEPQGDPLVAYERGKLKFRLNGEKLQGSWTLVRTRLPGGSKEQWLLIKERDETARSSREYDITEALPHSVLSRRRMNDAPVGSAPPSKCQDNAQEEISGSSMLDKARKSPLPETMKPQLATLVDEVPQDGDWLYEVKFDGYRLLARVENGDARLITRDGKDWTEKLPQHVQAIKALGLKSAWLDGEIVVLDRQGLPSFQLLQNAISKNGGAGIVYFLFDLPYMNGYDLRASPLRQRRALLEQMLADVPPEHLRYSAPIQQPAQKLLDSACQLAMEGIIGKLADAPYVNGRSDTWIKLKCRQRQEFVVIGYTEPKGSRKFLGALLLGVHDDTGKLHYAGRVGTGFDRATLQSSYRRLKPLAQRARPVKSMPAGVCQSGVHWVKPILVAEISFTEWTGDGLLRQAVFHGLRDDKPAAEIKREETVRIPAKKIPKRIAGSSNIDTVQGVRITHPQRMIDRQSGLTKLDLAHYYEQVAGHILPYLKNRPVYLLRCPEGVDGEKFFQKHGTRLSIPGVRMLDPALDPGHAPLMMIEDAHGLAGAAQMGAIELHSGNATADKFGRPDCMVFDLDPDPALPWQSVVEAARLTRVILDELGLKSFLKTSGGKGLHLVVPLTRRQDWDEVLAFSQAVARHLARTLPTLFSAKMGEKNRIGKIFIDYLRNRRLASTVVPYSVRARPGLPVATPIAWLELEDLSGPAAWNMASLPHRLHALQADPWEGYFATRQSLTAAMKRKLGLGKP